MRDRELEAMNGCYEFIIELEDDAKVRVVKYLIERFKIGTNPIIPTNTASIQPPLISQIKTINNESSEQIFELTESNNDEFPTLNELKIRNYPKTESEWVLCFAFYSSKYGNDTFKKDDIIEKYKEIKKFTDGNSANLSNNITTCIRKNWFKPTNATDYIMKDEGKNYALEILQGKSTSKERKSTNKKNNSVSKKIEG